MSGINLSEPLRSAALNGDDQLTDVNLAGDDGDTVLHLASRFGKLLVVRDLIARGSKINQPNDLRMTPLHLAAEKGHQTIVNDLLIAGANPSVTNNNGFSPFSLAVTNGHWQIAKTIQQGKFQTHPYELSQNDKSQFTKALFEQVSAGNIEKTKQLIALGAEVNPREASILASTSLHWAAHQGNVEMVNYLLSEGADPSIGDTKGRLPLIWAALDGNISMLEALLGGGANINSADNTGDTALSWAAYNGHLQAVRYLIANGADVNQADKQNRAPLFWAALNGHILTVVELVKNGASLELASRSDNTPFTEALCKGHLDIAKYLYDKGYRPRKQGDLKQLKKNLQTSVSEDNLAKVQQLLRIGADLTNALTLATYANNRRMVEVLFEIGARPDPSIKFTSVNTSIRELYFAKYKEIATTIKHYLSTRTDALRQASFGFHATIGFWQNNLSDRILAADNLYTAAHEYKWLHRFMSSRFSDEHKKSPDKELANHKLIAINGIARFLLRKDLFGEPVPFKLDAIKDELDQFDAKILEQAINIRDYLATRNVVINDHTFALGLRPSIGHIIREKIKIIIDQLTAEKPNNRAAYIAYQELFDELTSRYNRERSHWKDATDSEDKTLSQKAQALNEIFRYVLRKDIMLDAKLEPYERSALNPALAVPVPPPAYAPISTVATPAPTARITLTEVPAVITGTAPPEPVATQSAVPNAGAGAAAADLNPVASSDPTPDAFTAWFEREQKERKAQEVKKQQEFEQTAAELRTANAKPIRIDSDLALIDFSATATGTAAPVPTTPTPALAFATAEPTTVPAALERAASVSSIKSDESDESVDLLTLEELPTAPTTPLVIAPLNLPSAPTHTPVATENARPAEPLLA